jgi:hypothetical protein
MLIVLDNARDEAQVRPLLPGSATCRVVVTSRNLLAGLTALDAAHPLLLDVLPEAEAWDLLEQRLGPQRLHADDGATYQIIKATAPADTSSTGLSRPAANIQAIGTSPSTSTTPDGGAFSFSIAMSARTAQVLGFILIILVFILTTAKLASSRLLRLRLRPRHTRDERRAIRAQNWRRHLQGKQPQPATETAATQHPDQT